MGEIKENQREFQRVYIDLYIDIIGSKLDELVNML